MRINKFLASAGFASRRNAEVLVKDGRVKINGSLVTNLATEVSDGDKVQVDNQSIKMPKKQTYIMFNKPKGCVCTLSDDKGRKTVMDYIKDRRERLFPVGRLDYDSEGLLILTTDGDFANLLMHPSHEIEKVYVARVRGVVGQELITAFSRGIMLDGVRCAPASAKVLDVDKETSRVEVKIHEGKNRQVRRMFESLGFVVEFLKRTQVGMLKLGGLSRGTYRDLTEREIGYFIVNN